MVAQPNSLAGRDVASVIHPYTNLEAHKIVGPTVIAKGEGVYVYDDGGKKYLEGMAGLWSTSLGFSEKRLVEAAIRQMEAAADLSHLQRPLERGDDRTVSGAVEDFAEGPRQGAVCQLRLGGQRPGGQDRLVLQQRDRPARARRRSSAACAPITASPCSPEA